MRQIDHPLYKRWVTMRSRCNNPNATHFQSYGARGITVCDRWNDFTLFIEDMGECPDCYTLDRINVNGIYEPDNCRWASPLLQGRSKRPGKYISPNGSGFRVSLHLLPRTHHKRQ